MADRIEASDLPTNGPSSIQWDLSISEIEIFMLISDWQAWGKCSKEICLTNSSLHKDLHYQDTTLWYHEVQTCNSVISTIYSDAEAIVV